MKHDFSKEKIKLSTQTQNCNTNKRIDYFLEQWAYMHCPLSLNLKDNHMYYWVQTIKVLKSDSQDEAHKWSNKWTIKSMF